MQGNHRYSANSAKKLRVISGMRGGSENSPSGLFDQDAPSRRDPHMLVFDYCFLRMLLPMVLLLVIRVATINQPETSLLDLGNVILPCYLLFLYALEPDFFKRLPNSSPTRQHRVWLCMLLYNLAFMTIDKAYDLPLQYYVGDGYEVFRDGLHTYFGFGNFRARRSAILIFLIFGHLLSSSSYVQERPFVMSCCIPCFLCTLALWHFYPSAPIRSL
jgi:hypothetical protein